jgi:cell wall assembly regulator SMI1
MIDLWERIAKRLEEINPNVLESFTGQPDANLTILPQVLSDQNDILEFYAVVNGQDSGTDFVDQWTMLSDNDIVSAADLMNNEVMQDWLDQGLDIQAGEADGPVKPHLWNTRWVPFAQRNADLLCFDFDPPADGFRGQVILYYREPHPVRWISASFRDFLQEIAERLETGNYKQNKKRKVLLDWLV